jgi:acyl-homoserine-lactone acylase
MSRSITRAAAGRATTVLVAFVLVTAACSSDDDGGEATPTTEAGRAGQGDTYEATIHRTEGGVPHIVADDMASAAFGQGWASGQDRSCDLADQVLKIRGERASVLGAGDDDEHITSDLAWRTIGIFDIAVDEWETSVSGEVRELFDAYAAGWNGYLDDTGVDEIAGWCAGEAWVRPLEPVEIYAYSRAIALQASSGQLTGFLGAQPPYLPDEDPDATTTTTDGLEDTTTTTVDDDPTATTTTTTLTTPTVDDPDATTTTTTEDPATTTTEAALARLAEAPAGSNGWAIGSERAANGGGMLVANPHFPWEGELRFWEVHLTVPGEVDIYGAQLSGLPGIGIGFTETFGWTHTVSAGSRFTAYRLELVEGDPTSYVYDDGERAMESRDISVEVLGDDGSTSTVTRTAWSSHHGPVIDFPGFGWTETATIAFRDANLTNDAFAEQYVAMMAAADLDEFIAAHETHQGVPLFNTVAVSNDGRAWYADTSATPNLSEEAIGAWQEAVETDPVVAIAAESRAVLLEGSDPGNEWVEDPAARDPGLVPFSAMPMVERDDYVFNANDSFWMPHATEMLEGGYSPLHGLQGTPRTPRTRENAVVLGETGPDTPSGDDGLFTLEELADATLRNVGYTARALRAEVVERCEGADPVAADALTDPGGNELVPAGDVDLSEACTVLDAWDGRYDLDSVGPVLWREFLAGYQPAAFITPGELWAEPFDVDDPVGTPSGLVTGEGLAVDPVLANLARAVQVLDATDIALDTPWGEVQVAERNGTIVGIHGGDFRDGIPNAVGYSGGGSTLEEIPTRGDLLVQGSSLAEVGDRPGYRINNGTSFLLALAYDDDGPDARVFLSYSNTQDRTDPAFTEATERFSAKDWRTVRFTTEQIEADPDLTTTVVQG